MKLVNSTDPYVSMLIAGGENNEVIDLYKLNFFFAIESIDPRVARIRVTQTAWPTG